VKIVTNLNCIVRILIFMLFGAPPIQILSQNEKFKVFLSEFHRRLRMWDVTVLSGNVMNYKNSVISRFFGILPMNNK
jgi:hypothetical protein